MPVANQSNSEHCTLAHSSLLAFNLRAFQLRTGAPLTLEDRVCTHDQEQERRHDEEDACPDECSKVHVLMPARASTSLRVAGREPDKDRDGGHHQ